MNDDTRCPRYIIEVEGNFETQGITVRYSMETGAANAEEAERLAMEDAVNHFTFDVRRTDA